MAGQIAQRANVGGRNEARPNQAVRQELGKPLAILHIGLRPGTALM